MSIALLLAAVLACVICQAFFAASEVALVAADDLKVHAERERGDRRAMVLGRLLQHRDLREFRVRRAKRRKPMMFVIVLDKFQMWPSFS